MIIEEGFYVWSPIFLQSKNPDTARYFGNVIGNVSLEDQLQVVGDAGASQIEDIRTIGSQQTQELTDLARKFSIFWSIADRVEKSITGVDPTERSADPTFIEDYVENYVDSSAESPVGGSENGSDDEPSTESSDAEYYIWRQNAFQILNEENSRYFGNVIGNIPVQELIQEVRNVGDAQKELIVDLGSIETEDIRSNSEKFRTLADINRNTLNSIMDFFGGVFVLDSSRLDNIPLG